MKILAVTSVLLVNDKSYGPLNIS